jgi:ABC-type transporter MlaC component
MRPDKRVVASLIILGTLVAAHADDGSESTALVRRLYRTAVEIAQGLEAGAAVRAGSAALRGSFDSPTIARKVLGEYWGRASAGDRRMSIEYVQDTIVDAVVRHLGNRYSESSVFVGTRRLSNGDILVATRLTRPSGRVANLDWRVHRCASGPCIVDLLVDGASLSIQRRDEFAALMRSGGGSVGEVIARMRTAPHSSSR